MPSDFRRIYATPRLARFSASCPSTCQVVSHEWSALIRLTVLIGNIILLVSLANSIPMKLIASRIEKQNVVNRTPSFRTPVRTGAFPHHLTSELVRSKCSVKEDLEVM